MTDPAELGINQQNFLVETVRCSSEVLNHAKQIMEEENLEVVGIRGGIVRKGERQQAVANISRIGHEHRDNAFRATRLYPSSSFINRITLQEADPAIKQKLQKIGSAAEYEGVFILYHPEKVYTTQAIGRTPSGTITLLTNIPQDYDRADLQLKSPDAILAIFFIDPSLEAEL